VTEARTIVFFPEGAYGPTNNCVGIGQVLRSRGHRVVFVVEESFAGTLEAKGFEERLMRLGPPPAEPEVPGQFWIDFIRDTAPVFRTSTLEQLGGFIAPTWQALIDGSKYVTPRLTEVFDELGADVTVEDHLVGFPAIAASGRPWVRIVSCNPAELKDPSVPPFSSGYPVADRRGWPEFLEEVREALRRGDLPPEQLGLEITESVLMKDASSPRSTLEALRAMGVRVLIDDFGTGYSSLARLRHFPVDVIKIDRSFVDGLGQDNDDTAIVAAVIEIARSMDLQVIAEGVEVGAQLERLRELGCHAGQGYLFSGPIEGDAVAALLADAAPRTAVAGL